LDEHFALPENLPQIHKIVYYDMVPSIEEQKVLGNRLVFRGQMDVRMMYMTEEGQLHQWDTDVPFSQYTELDGDYGTNATAWIMPIMTAMEMDITEPQQLNIRAGIANQYTIFDRTVLDVVEDAFSPSRDVAPVVEQMQFPALLDSVQMQLQAEGTLNGEAKRILLASPRTEYPVIRMNGECLQLRMDGQFQILYENEEGQMSTDSLRFNSMLPLPSATENQTELWLQESSQPELLPTADGFHVISSYPVTVQTYSGRTLPMVTELDVGQQREADPDRPSILLRRAGDEGLWAIAKGYGSTVDAIMEANQLSGEPENGQMLLIPIT
jgi:hypothetical protein